MQVREQAGFTLLELLIAMVIFSFMSIMAYGALVNIFKSNEVVAIQEKKLKTLKRTMMFLERDMRQIVLRPRSKGFGEAPFPALVSGLDSEGVIEFTRAGNSNSTNMVRSTLQRVRYDLQENVLKRMSWNLVDHIDAEPVTMPLLDDVDTFTLRFLTNKNQWQENWSSNDETPKAVELTLEHKSWGKIIRLFSVR